MKKILSLLLTAIIFISCENTDEPEKDYYKMIGTVNVKLFRVHESGRILGKCLCGYYLSGIKVELINENEVVETTYTIADTLVDYFYKFEKIELDEKYKIRITLNDEMIEYTDKFIVTAEDIKEFPNDSVREGYFSKLQWFKKGMYYIDMLFPGDSINFDQTYYEGENIFFVWI